MFVTGIDIDKWVRTVDIHQKQHLANLHLFPDIDSEDNDLDNIFVYEVLSSWCKDIKSRNSKNKTNIICCLIYEHSEGKISLDIDKKVTDISISQAARGVDPASRV